MAGVGQQSLEVGPVVVEVLALRQQQDDAAGGAEPPPVQPDAVRLAGLEGGALELQCRHEFEWPAQSPC